MVKIMANVVNPRPSTRTFAAISMTTAADGLSEEVNITGLTLCAVEMSTAWTAAAIGFQASIGSTNFYPIYNTAGDHLTYPTSANRIVVFDPAQFAGIQKVKLVSETSAGVAVAQTAARTLILGLSEQ
jgi:hypothetical protein